VGRREGREPLGEDAARAVRRVAAPAARPQADPHHQPLPGQIADYVDIAVRWCEKIPADECSASSAAKGGQAMHVKRVGNTSTTGGGGVFARLKTSQNVPGPRPERAAAPLCHRRVDGREARSLDEARGSGIEGPTPSRRESTRRRPMQHRPPGGGCSAARPGGGPCQVRRERAWRHHRVPAGRRRQGCATLALVRHRELSVVSR